MTCSIGGIRTKTEPLCVYIRPRFGCARRKMKLQFAFSIYNITLVVCSWDLAELKVWEGRTCRQADACRKVWRLIELYGELYTFMSFVEFLNSFKSIAVSQSPLLQLWRYLVSLIRDISLSYSGKMGVCRFEEGVRRIWSYFRSILGFYNSVLIWEEFLNP